MFAFLGSTKVMVVAAVTAVGALGMASQQAQASDRFSFSFSFGSAPRAVVYQQPVYQPVYRAPVYQQPVYAAPVSAPSCEAPVYPQPVVIQPAPVCQVPVIRPLPPVYEQPRVMYGHWGWDRHEDRRWNDRGGWRDHDGRYDGRHDDDWRGR